MPDGTQPVQGPDGNLYQFPQGTTKEAAIAYFKKKGIGAPKSVEAPDATKQAQETISKMSPTETSGRVEKRFPSGAHRFMTKEEDKHLDELLKMAPQRAKDIRKEALTLGGASFGGAVVGPLEKTAEAAAGGSRLLRWLLPAVTRASGTAVGAGTGAVAGGAGPKEALATGTTFGGTELGLEGMIEGARTTAKVVRGSKAGQIVKQAAKPKVEIMAEEHATAAREAEAKYQKELTAHREQVQGIKAQDERAKTEFKTSEDLKQHQQDLAKTVGDNLKLADKRISAKLGEEFEQVSAAVEKKNPRVKVTDAEREARGKLFFPDSVQAFNNIMENFGSKLGMGDFSILRKTYSRLNEVLYSGREMPTDLYQAVKTVRDSLGKDLQAAAKEAGEGPRYSRAMQRYADYKNDWHDTAAGSKGGTQISKILSAEDPQYVIDNLQGKTGQRLIETLKKYGEFGADSGLAQRLRDFSARLKTLPAPKTMPEPTKIPAAPSRPDVVSFDRESEQRKIMANMIKKLLFGGLAGGGGAYAYNKLLGEGQQGPHVP